MIPQSKSITHALTELGENQGSPMHVHFPDITVTNAGASVTRAAAAQGPALSISTAKVTLNPAGRYVAILLDLDAPYPSAPFVGPIAHGIQADLRVVAPGQHGEAAFVRLTPTCEPVLPYLPPSPPPFSSPHRYLFMLWDQPEGITSEDIKSRLGLPATPGMMDRVRWDEEAFEKKIGLGLVIAGTCFLC